MGRAGPLAAPAAPPEGGAAVIWSKWETCQVGEGLIRGRTEKERRGDGEGDGKLGRNVQALGVSPGRERASEALQRGSFGRGSR